MTKHSYSITEYWEPASHVTIDISIFYWQPGSSLFVCSDQLSYCKAENLYMDLRNDGRRLSDRSEII